MDEKIIVVDLYSGSFTDEFGGFYVKKCFYADLDMINGIYVLITGHAREFLSLIVKALTVRFAYT